MSGTCSTCKHWHNLTGEYGVCELVKPMDVIREGAPPMPFFDGDSSAFYTPPGYGCNLHPDSGRPDLAAAPA